MLQHRKNQPARVTWYVHDDEIAQRIGITGLDLEIKAGENELGLDFVVLSVLMGLIVFGGYMYVQFLDEKSGESEAYAFEMDEDGSFCVIPKAVIEKNLTEHPPENVKVVAKEFDGNF